MAGNALEDSSYNLLLGNCREANFPILDILDFGAYVFVQMWSDLQL